MIKTPRVFGKNTALFSVCKKRTGVFIDKNEKKDYNTLRWFLIHPKHILS